MLKHPSDMTPDQRIEEIAIILASAITRMRLKKLRKNNHYSVDSSPKESVYATRVGGEKS